MSVTEREIRNAAEVLLTGSYSSQLHSHSQPHSQPSPYHFYASYLHDEDIYVGMSRNNRMSVVRRFFCLLVTFDLLLTGLMWLMCMMLVSGGDIIVSFTSQVVHYHITSSLFDIVMAAISRFTVLLLFYGLLRSSHWCAVAISTAGTCIFLIAKVFVFDWAKASQPTFQVMLILVSFVLAWGEAWFLDFRVLSQEMKAKECLLSSTMYQESERNPIVRNYINNLPGSRDNPESIANFYSPLESPQDSDDEAGSSNQCTSKPLDYHKHAKEILEKAWVLINSPDWQLEKETVEGATVHSKTVLKGSKVFRLTAKINVSASVLLSHLFDHVGEMPSWNPTVIESERLEVIDRQTDITYQVSAAGGGGVVGSRDFVVLRHWEMIDGSYVSANASVPHPKRPPVKKYIRGENYPGCWVMKPIPGEDNWCVFQWLMNTNLKGWLPQYVVDSAFTNVMLEFLEHLKTYGGMLSYSSLPNSLN
ncbi:steroidogenic acute regulatory protein-like [Frankliniella occidentalis]|uniref:Steroidogenic acute regulatory protein-like n=1 Tax=Frankliniella occidentalis TaxID=133901 RepID=A0A6J1RZF8_FRAOC|nr:steroidogenic acute regulatory protein-like [Frankliniella occidentalis]